MEELSWEIKWSDALSMSHSEIDAAHQHFIGLVNRLNKTILSQQQDKTVIEEIMGHLLEDAIDHFQHEELILAEHAYPAVEQHAQIHAELIDKTRQAVKEIQGTDIRAVWVKAGLSIKNLLVAHLLNEDTKYIKYIQTESPLSG